MTNMLTALANAGLASKTEVAARNLSEQNELQQKQRSLVPKTFEELLSCKGYKFFERVGWIIQFLEDHPSSENAQAAKRFAEKHMTGGDAGRQFVLQIDAFGKGALSLSDWKKAWPKVFAG